MSFLSIKTPRTVSSASNFKLEERNSADHFIVEDPENSLRISLCRREGYPTTYCDRQDDGTFLMGYGDRAKRIEHEFLEVHVNKDGTVLIERDRFATLPLYYAATDDGLLVNNQYHEIVHGLRRLTLSHARLLESLTTSWARLPLTHEVRYLRHGEKLRFKGGKLEITHPEDRPWILSSEVPTVDPKQFFGVLNEYFDFFIKTRLKNQRCIFEVSGGLDSATLPQYYALFFGATPTCSTVYYTHGRQRSRVRAFAEKTGAKIISHEPSPTKSYPLSHVINLPRPHHYEFNYDSHSQYLDKLQALKPDVHITGLGGDEMLSNVTDPEYMIEHGEVERQRRRKQKLPSYLTPAFREAYISTAPNEPQGAIPLLLNSVYDAHLANNQHIERGIWPVSPFTDPELFRWCNGLPIQFRVNKNILRTYHQAYDFTPEIYMPMKHEEYGEYSNIGFRSGVYDEPIQQLAAASVAAKMGYVDIIGLFRAYERAKKGEYPEADEDQFTILRWMSAEINAQYSGFHAVV